MTAPCGRPAAPKSFLRENPRHLAVPHLRGTCRAPAPRGAPRGPEAAREGGGGLRASGRGPGRAGAWIPERRERVSHSPPPREGGAHSTSAPSRHYGRAHSSSLRAWRGGAYQLPRRPKKAFPSERFRRAGPAGRLSGCR